VAPDEPAPETPGEAVPDGGGQPVPNGGGQPAPNGAGQPVPNGSGKPAPSAFDFLALGVTMALLVGLGGGLGLLVDDWLGSSPWATFAGLALGIAFAALALWEQARRYL
jgi:hypothetical protein